MPFFVYMLLCRDGSFYVGSTDDLERRIAQHHSGETGGYTSTRRPLQVVYVLEVPSRDDARVLEHKLKGWSRAKKVALISGQTQWLKALAWGRNRNQPPPAI